MQHIPDQQKHLLLLLQLKMQATDILVQISSNGYKIDGKFACFLTLTQMTEHIDSINLI